MKIKKYTKGAWTDLDKPVKKFGAYTDTATTLPLTIEASATDAIENYQVYGTSEGAGVETENLVIGIIEKANIDATTGFIRGNVPSFNMHIAKVVEGREYMITTPITTPLDSDYVYGFFRTFPSVGSQSYNNSRVVTKRSTFTAPIDGYIAFRSNSNDTLVMLTEGSTAPTSYIPPGFKIPISNTSGEQQSNYDLFIGSTKLGEDEYLDYGEQKVYKYVDGVLTPQDPPAPFPAIQAYKGENNLSVDTTVQPEKVAVEYEGWKGVGDVEKYQNEEWSDNNDT